MHSPPGKLHLREELGLKNEYHGTVEHGKCCGTIDTVCIYRTPRLFRFPALTTFRLSSDHEIVHVGFFFDGPWAWNLEPKQRGSVQPNCLGLALPTIGHVYNFIRTHPEEAGAIVIGRTAGFELKKATTGVISFCQLNRQSKLRGV
jgi:hypothetical protein